MKLCRDCGIKKEDTEFYRDRSTKDGLQCRCKDCDYEKDRKYREANKERLSVLAAQYRARHREVAKESCKRWREKNREKISTPEYKRARLEKQREWRIKNPDKVKNTILKHEHGVTLEQYNAMLLKQGNRCAICHRGEDEVSRCFAVDHDHVTGKIRGLLCTACNQTLGLVRDSIVTLNNAILYLQDNMVKSNVDAPV